MDDGGDSAAVDIAAESSSASRERFDARLSRNRCDRCASSPCAAREVGAYQVDRQGGDPLSTDAQPSRTATDSHFPRRPRSRVRTAATVVVLAALAWRLAASLAGAWSEFAGTDALGRTVVERVSAFDEPYAARRRHTLGFAAPVCDSIAAHVPADGVIAVAGSASRRCELLVRAVAATTWPRRIIALDGVAAAEIARGDVAGAPLYLLAYRVEREPDPEPWERVDGDADFSLWKARATPR